MNSPPTCSWMPSPRAAASRRDAPSTAPECCQEPAHPVPLCASDPATISTTVSRNSARRAAQREAEIDPQPGALSRQGNADAMQLGDRGHQAETEAVAGGAAFLLRADRSAGRPFSARPRGCRRRRRPPAPRYRRSLVSADSAIWSPAGMRDRVLQQIDEHLHHQPLVAEEAQTGAICAVRCFPLSRAIGSKSSARAAKVSDSSNSLKLDRRVPASI